MAKAVVASGRRVSILLILLSLLSLIRGFAPITIPSTAAVRSGPSSTQLYFFGQPKDDGSPGDYLCPVRCIGGYRCTVAYRKRGALRTEVVCLISLTRNSASIPP